MGLEEEKEVGLIFFFHPHPSGFLSFVSSWDGDGWVENRTEKGWDWIGCSAMVLSGRLLLPFAVLAGSPLFFFLGGVWIWVSSFCALLA